MDAVVYFGVELRIIVKYRDTRPDLPVFFILSMLFVVMCCMTAFSVVEHLTASQYQLEQAYQKLEDRSKQAHAKLLDSAFDGLFQVDPANFSITESSSKSDKLFGTKMQGSSLLDYSHPYSKQQLEQFVFNAYPQAGHDADAQRVDKDQESTGSDMLTRQEMGDSGNDGEVLSFLATFKDASSAEFDCELRLYGYLERKATSDNQRVSSCQYILLGLRLVGEKRLEIDHAHQHVPTDEIIFHECDAQNQSEQSAKPPNQELYGALGEFLGKACIDVDGTIRACSAGWSEVFQGDVQGEKFLDLIFPTDVKLFQVRLANVSCAEATRIRLRVARPARKTLFEAAFVLSKPDDEETQMLQMQNKLGGGVTAAITVHGPLIEQGYAKENILRHLKPSSHGTRSLRSSSSSGSGGSSRRSSRSSRSKRWHDENLGDQCPLGTLMEEPSSENT